MLKKEIAEIIKGIIDIKAVVGVNKEYEQKINAVLERTAKTLPIGAFALGSIVANGNLFATAEQAKVYGITPGAPCVIAYIEYKDVYQVVVKTLETIKVYSVEVFCSTFGE